MLKLYVLKEMIRSFKIWLSIEEEGEKKQVVLILLTMYATFS